MEKKRRKPKAATELIACCFSSVTGNLKAITQQRHRLFILLKKQKNDEGKKLVTVTITELLHKDEKIVGMFSYKKRSDKKNKTNAQSQKAKQ